MSNIMPSDKLNYATKKNYGRIALVAKQLSDLFSNLNINQKKSDINSKKSNINLKKSDIYQKKKNLNIKQKKKIFKVKTPSLKNALRFYSLKYSSKYYSQKI
jgi:hypothetical protein